MKERFKVIPAVYVLFEKDGRLLMLQRAGSGYFDGYYSLPAGHFNGGESAKTAAVREVEEEIGINLNPENLELVHTLHRLAFEEDHERIDLFFRAKNWSGEPKNIEPDKCTDLAWFTLDKLPDKVTPEVKFVLDKIKVGKNYSDFNF